MFGTIGSAWITKPWLYPRVFSQWSKRWLFIRQLTALVG